MMGITNDGAPIPVERYVEAFELMDVAPIDIEAFVLKLLDPYFQASWVGGVEQGAHVISPSVSCAAI